MAASRVSFAALVAGALLSACGGDHARPANAVAPSPIVQSAKPAFLANWTADAAVLSRTNGGRGTCGWGTAVGETRAGVAWRITIAGASISLEEDMQNFPTDHIPYTGTLSGTQFTAAYSQGIDSLLWACQFTGGTLSGRFSADFSSFEALESLSWGAAEQETTVQRRWVGAPVLLTVNQ
jgi:hypothetical protein